MARQDIAPGLGGDPGAHGKQPTLGAPKTRERLHLPLVRTTWDLSHLVPGGDTDPFISQERAIIEADTTRFIQSWGGERRDYLTDPALFAEALRDYETWATTHHSYGKSGFYFQLRTAQDQTNEGVKKQQGLFDSFSAEIDGRMTFFQDRIANIPLDRQPDFLDHPDLADYRHFLETRWAEAPYLLTPEAEAVLRRLQDTSNDRWVSMTSEFISKEQREIEGKDGEPQTITAEDINSLLKSPGKITRYQAAVALDDILSTHSDVAEREINAVLAYSKARADLKGYKRPDAERHIQDDIDSEVVDAMLSAVSGNFDISRRYYSLKAQLLGLGDQFKYRDRNAEYPTNVQTTYEPQEAVDIVYTVLARLDPEFGAIFADFVTNGRIDMDKAPGKEPGAFCAARLLTTPVYLLQNFSGRLDDVTTLAHETGHGIHYESMRGQNELNYASSLATAEVASTFTEDFVFKEVLADVDDETRFALLMKKMDSTVAQVFRQTACYLFEQQLHSAFAEEGYLTQDEIGTMFRSQMEAYIGGTLEDSENKWINWPHIRVPFYVYTYSSGALISQSLQASVGENPAFIENVKKVLAAGTSDSPRNLFASLGIDIADSTFWEKGLANIDDNITELEQLAVKLGKIPAKDDASWIERPKWQEQFQAVEQATQEGTLTETSDTNDLFPPTDQPPSETK